MKSKQITIPSMIALVVLMIFAPLSRAQSDSITVDVELSRSRVYVGDELSYQIIIRGADNPPTPEIEFPPTVRAQFHGRTKQSFTSMRIINGRSRTVTDQSYSFQYTLTAVEAGNITVPPPTLTIDNQEYSGPQATFESLFPARSDTDDMEMLIERTEIYLNETVIVTCAWWIGDQTSEFSLSSTSIPRSFEIRGLEPNTKGQQRVPFEINGEQMVGVTMDDRHNGRDMKKLVFRFSLTPTQLGTFSLGPVRAVFTRHNGVGRNYRSYIEAPPQQILVKPVPVTGQPAGYAGAIGSFGLSAKASNTNVNVGDPIELTLRVTGKEPMVGIDSAPDLNEIQGFADQFKISSDGWRETLPRRQGLRIYQTTIRATSDGVSSIPSIELPSFNPSTGSYRINRSKPIAITVNPVEEVTLSDAIITGGSSLKAPKEDIERTELTHAMPGIWAHGSLDEMLAQPGFDLNDITNPVWIAAVATPPSVFMLSLFFVLARGVGDPSTRALDKVWRRSRSLDRRGEHTQALRLYVAQVLGINRDSLVAEDATQLPISQEDARAIGACLSGLEWGDYAGAVNTDRKRQSHRPNLLRDLHKQVRAARRAQSC